jgi:hypothetical protein
MGCCSPQDVPAEAQNVDNTAPCQKSSRFAGLPAKDAVFVIQENYHFRSPRIVILVISVPVLKMYYGRMGKF